MWKSLRAQGKTARSWRGKVSQVLAFPSHFFPLVPPLLWSIISVFLLYSLVLTPYFFHLSLLVFPPSFLLCSLSLHVDYYPCLVSQVLYAPTLSVAKWNVVHIHLDAERTVTPKFEIVLKLIHNPQIRCSQRTSWERVSLPLVLKLFCGGNDFVVLFTSEMNVKQEMFG